MKKNVLIVHRYFYPDTPTYARLLYKIAIKISTFTKVFVLTSFPSYYGSSGQVAKKNEKINNIVIKRIKLFSESNRKFSTRIFNSIYYSFYIFFYILRYGGKKFQLIQIATTPPILPALMVKFASKIKNCEYVYHCQDIFPDLVLLNKKSSLLQLFKKIDKIIMQNAKRVVVLSEDMKSNLILSRKINPNKISVINNFNIESNTLTKNMKLPQQLDFLKETKLKSILFAGNLGYLQNLDLLFSAISKLLENEDFYFIVIGEGVKKQNLQKKYINKNIIFSGYLSNDIVQNIYSCVNFGVAPIEPGVEKLAYPSKIISYVSNGLPVLSFAQSNSEIEDVVNKYFGKNYAFEGINQLSEIILELLNSSFNRDKIKKKARELFGEASTLNQWDKLYNELLK